MIATALLPERVSIAAERTTGMGATWQTRDTGVPARLTSSRRSVRSGNGDDRISSMRMTVRPDVTIAVGEKVTHGDDTYTVLAVTPAGDLNRPWALIADLGGPR